jgi:UDP-N-acetylmuramoyl-L-alanyl-D-glutamate--2,6-diaminopimelate ligase
VRIELNADRREAICDAIKQAEVQDVVLIAGKGHERYQEIKGQKYPFDDVAIAKAALVGV